jgi:FAD/FMN-containing dehydrogenase
MISLNEYESQKHQFCEQLRNAKNVRLNKNTSNLFRHQSDGKNRLIDVRSFNKVISVDTAALTADVEGMITYEDLVNETLKFGLIPAVVPELKTITVGGATTGIGLEASSFKYGFVHETIEEIDVLLPGGTAITCSRRDNSDLFFAFPNSYGTFGYALRLRVKLVPIRSFVKVAHRRLDDFATYFSEMKSACSSQVDFIDGTIFSNNEMYLTTGTFVDSAPYLSDYTYMNIFYKSIRERTEDYMTTLNFLWRWDTDWYWGSKKFGAQIPLIRRLLGKERLRSSFYWKLRSQLNKTPFWKLLSPIVDYETVIQDVDIPIEHASEFMDFQSKQIGITPVWACPVNAYDKTVQYPLYPLSPSRTYVNLGFWDVVKTTHEPGYFNRLVEKEVSRLEGRKILYSDSFYPADDFYALYGGATYTALKNKYDPQHALRTLYEKCVARN